MEDGKGKSPHPRAGRAGVAEREREYVTGHYREHTRADGRAAGAAGATRRYFRGGAEAGAEGVEARGTRLAKKCVYPFVGFLPAAGLGTDERGATRGYTHRIRRNMNGLATARGLSQGAVHAAEEYGSITCSRYLPSLLYERSGLRDRTSPFP